MEKGKILIPKLIQVGEELANTINMTRHYMNQATATAATSNTSTIASNTSSITTSAATTAALTEKSKSVVSFTFDPRYLVFEFVWNLQLRKKQIEIVNDFRTNLALGKFFVHTYSHYYKSLRLCLIVIIYLSSIYIFIYLFIFTFIIITGNSKVKQMIMGAGKTSVVAPLLALIVADGKSLVLSVVPKALIEMSRTRMRETFAAIMVKRVYTLEFDRSTKITSSMRRSLENAAVNRGIVVATPTTLKSIMLSYIEVLQTIKELQSKGGITKKLTELNNQAIEFTKVLSLFKEGVMLLDEVDLILHPLKRYVLTIMLMMSVLLVWMIYNQMSSYTYFNSFTFFFCSELNFPIGEKFDLDGSADGERWSLPIHLLDAIFYHSTSRVRHFFKKLYCIDLTFRYFI